MDHATLMHIATLSTDDRVAAVEDLVDLLVSRGMTDDELDRLERQVHQVNAILAQSRKPH